MKGLVLAGGTGSRMYPVTQSVNKHLLPVFDKPMIFYAISVLMLGNIREIGVVCRDIDKPAFERLLGDGSKLGLKIEYIIQTHAAGIADGIKQAKRFLDDAPFCLILGDNFFFGPGLTPLLKDAMAKFKQATAFAYEVKNPSSFGVISYNKLNQVVSIEEKPSKPKSNKIATGLYMFDKNAISYVEKLTASNRGELEITDLLNVYIKNQGLSVEVLGRGYAWLDMGTSESLMEASVFIQSIEKRQGFKIACLEEIAFRKDWISITELQLASEQYKNTTYGEYLSNVLTTLK
ncbi:glucose-1-phosphate thymidylyltransferase RfbA [Pseudoalteromonas rubra]|uniref:Glucose-1-phosphate thymidylyltransferase n=1 Tax=Pseudoalteromonas rubra TaxID=43658 RepID=A0A0F4QYJ6_9GAMM|nr:glucose-1-phosphate thymidylyltransferase RfbA [Pseudoalteromonas rubra]KJZ11657.1 glucose-1-phosphate thymidylyltransferase [Pseudoalteromonas rubra]